MKHRMLGCLLAPMWLFVLWYDKAKTRFKNNKEPRDE